MAVLAINRLHAVFFIFSYQRVWKKENVKYIIFAIFLFNVVYTGSELTIIYMGITTGILQSIHLKGIFMGGDVPLITSFCTSLIIYLAVITKFCYNYKIRDKSVAEVDNENVAKDRILMLAICLVSTLPCPLLICGYKLYAYVFSQYGNNPENEQIFLHIIIYVIYNSNFILIECIEEVCLFVMSKEFRKLVKNQFVKNSQNNVATFNASRNSQQQRMRQVNTQRNNYTRHLQTRHFRPDICRYRHLQI
uniref:Uncharacterized protein n=1 Tax=Meloidogyne enterolobii TaxID=390850 RepID=A0A6V7UCY3_MELEN|nr:unnamed protein product [Meloidogyne enterolobii]